MTDRRHDRRRTRWIAPLLVVVGLGVMIWLGLAVADRNLQGDETSGGNVPGGNMTDALPIDGPMGQAVVPNFPPSSSGPEPPPVVAQSVWWMWTAPEHGRFTFATHGSEFDTILRVHSGTAPDDLTEMAMNDDDGDVLTSSVSVEVTLDETYYVEVTAKDGAAGLVTLTWSKNG